MINEGKNSQNIILLVTQHPYCTICQKFILSLPDHWLCDHKHKFKIQTTTLDASYIKIHFTTSKQDVHLALSSSLKVISSRIWIESGEV